MGWLPIRRCATRGCAGRMASARRVQRVRVHTTFALFTILPLRLPSDADDGNGISCLFTLPFSPRLRHATTHPDP